MEDFDIEIANSVIIGDRDDMEGEMGRKLGIKIKFISSIISFIFPPLLPVIPKIIQPFSFAFSVAVTTFF